MIIKGCLVADKHSQEELYRACYAPMIKICLRFTGNSTDAGIVLNEAMLKVYQGIAQYKGEGAFEAWVKRIVINCCIDHCRKKMRFSRNNTLQTNDEMLIFEPDVYSRISAREILQLINNLPGNTALVFNLFAIEGYTHENIGMVLGIAIGTSKWHLNEARRLLKIELANLIRKESFIHDR